ncbi:Aste57867_15264 [Aphanomyces stellatus]|uniref:Aste57867_15264 protein n=1 Tax=Aphanomyces stellatus TaxID=120398 RepID=A0A485L2R4_9STRA|nr:hypothetical protein As57867_015208 [Aphanomyces stellatus]VFT92073.1 Aste57867_15264 [Aphanomyces stellatus]
MSGTSYQTAEQLLFDQATHNDQAQNLAREKTIAVVTDNNQGSYQSGLITIDAASQLMGSKGFASLRDSYIVLPYVVSLQNRGSVAMGGQVNRFCVGMKNGVWNVIDSMQVELDGKTILTDGDYKLYWNNIRCQTEWSSADLDKHGADAFVAPDDWNSIAWGGTGAGPALTTSATLSGDGWINNFTNEQAAAGTSIESLQLGKNDGFTKRLYNNPQPSGIIGGGGFNPFGWVTQRSAVAPTIAMQNGKGVFASTTAAAAAGAIAGEWYHMLKIRLIDLHPLFKEIDLIGNPSLKIRLRVNAGYCDIIGTGAVYAAGPPLTGSTMSLSSTTMTSGNTVPVMIASAAANNAVFGVLPTSGAINLRLAFGPLQNAVTQIGNVGQYFPFTTARLMIPFYDLHPSRTQQSISKPVKKISFLDCYAQYFTKRAGFGTSLSQLNESINLQLSAFQKNIKYVMLIPFSETSTGHWANASANGTEDFRSPFSTAPWACQPGSAVRNFQVSVGNKNVFAKTVDFDYEAFHDEFKKLGSVNGSLTHEISNGLLSHQHYALAHRYMVADCSRITDPNVPQSCVVSGINACCQGMNALILVVFERSLSYDRITGEISLDD